MALWVDGWCSDWPPHFLFLFVLWCSYGPALVLCVISYVPIVIDGVGLCVVT